MTGGNELYDRGGMREVNKVLLFLGKLRTRSACSMAETVKYYDTPQYLHNSSMYTNI